KVVNEELTIDITDIAGRKFIHQNLISNNNICILKFDLTVGIYFITITNTSGAKQTQKLIISK
ncbi:MAG: T9SS type A sorting domain-containing protein, partial [Bacteroidota bacterium]